MGFSEENVFGEGRNLKMEDWAKQLRKSNELLQGMLTPLQDLEAKHKVDMAKLEEKTKREANRALDKDRKEIMELERQCQEVEQTTKHLKEENDELRKRLAGGGGGGGTRQNRTFFFF